MWRYIVLAALLASLATVPSSDAAVTANSAVTAQTPNNGKCSFVQGVDSAGTYKTCYTGGLSGSKIVGIFITSNDGTAHIVTVQLSTSTSAHCSPQSNCLGGAAVTVPASAGMFTTNGAVNMMSIANWPGLPVDATGNPYFFLSGNTQTVEATFATNLTASTQVNVNVIAADF